MDNLDVTDTHYNKKISDLQRRLDAQYDRIDEVEETIHAGMKVSNLYISQVKRKCGIDRGNEMFEELGISFSTALIVLLALYFIIKWAVKNGIKEAYRDITGKVTTEDIEAEQICNEEEK